MNTLTLDGIKFNKYSVSTASHKARVHYSRNVSAQSVAAGMPIAVINIYAKDYGDQLKPIFAKTRNDSNSQTDYFETDKITFYEGSAIYDELDVLLQSWSK